MTWATDTAATLTAVLRATVATIDGDETVVPPVPDRYEIGSVTKTMTATLVALQPNVTLTDRIGQWLAAGPNADITIHELITHTSGLPSMAFHPADPNNPWQDYTFDRAEADLPNATRGTPRYSNLGYQLLALILQRASGTPYPELLTASLCTPLHMTNTTVDTGQWPQPLGAGGVMSTIDDMARYARAALFPRPTPLGDALARSLGWRETDGVHEHSGGTAHFSACVSVDRSRGRAIAILSTTPGGPARSAHLKQAARHTLAGRPPTPPPQPSPTWHADALAITRSLLDGETAQVHARLSPDARTRVPVERLTQAWQRQACPPGEITILRHEMTADGDVVADIAIAGERRIRMKLLADGTLGGLAFP